MATQLKLVDATTVQRVLSWLIDALPLFILWLAFLPRLMGKAAQAAVAPEIIGQMMTTNLVLLVISLGYTVFLWWWEATQGKTVGNLVMKIRTTNMEGNAPGWKSVIIRRLLIGVGGLIPVIGPALVAASNEFDKNGKRQGWHDKVAGTLVFDVKAGRNPLVSGGSDGPSSFAPPATNGRREFKDGDVAVEHDADAAHSMVLPLGTPQAAKPAPAAQPAKPSKPAGAAGKKPAAKAAPAKAAPAAKSAPAQATPAAKSAGASKAPAQSEESEVISSVPGAKKPAAPTAAVKDAQPADKPTAKPASPAPAKPAAKTPATPKPASKPGAAAAAAPAAAASEAVAKPAKEAAPEKAAAQPKPQVQPAAKEAPAAAKPAAVKPAAAPAPQKEEQPAAAEASAPVAAPVPRTPEIVQASYDPDVDGGETRLREAITVPVHLLFDDGADILVEDSALIGRNPQPSQGVDVAELLVVDDPQRTVSKTHLLVSAGPQGVWVTDQGSANGTYVLNADGTERKLEAGTPSPAVFGSIVHFGERYFKVSNS